MLVSVTGKVVKVEVKPPYVNKRGESVQSWDAWLGSSDPTRGADRISGPVDLGVPSEGDYIAADAMVSARSGQYGPYLSVWVRALDLLADPAAAAA